MKVYRAHIVEYPEFEQRVVTLDFDNPQMGKEYAECPVGWVPSAEYLERFKTDRWFEPSTEKFFKSRNSAMSRVKLLEAAGYKAIMQEGRVEWPADGERKIPKSGSLPVWKRIRRAVNDLVELGVIDSPERVLG